MSTDHSGDGIHAKPCRGLGGSYAFYPNPLTAKLFNLNFHPLQVSENYSDLTKWRSTVFKYC